MARPYDDLNQHDVATALSGSLPGLVKLTDLDIELMSDDSVKQMLMDIRGTNHLVRIRNYSNEQIARFSREEAAQMLLDARDVLLGRPPISALRLFSSR